MYSRDLNTDLFRNVSTPDILYGIKFPVLSDVVKVHHSHTRGQIVTQQLSSVTSPKDMYNINRTRNYGTYVKKKIAEKR